MARLATIARRSFLIGTAAVAGGVAIGYWAYRRDPANPLLDGLGAGWSTLNPYVRIDADGVTLITPRADVGQGATSIQAALLAEEMDLAWGRFRTEPGPPGAAYYNGKVVAEGIPIAGTSDGFGVIADNIWRAFQAAAMVKPEWGPAPYPATSAALFASVAESFVDARRDSRLRDDGDVEAALDDAGAGLLEAEYRVPYLAHAPLEPMNAVVQFKDGRLDIWTGTQIPRFLVAAAAALAGLDERQVHLHAQISGGSFGRRLEDDYVRQAVLLARTHPGVPIKMTWTREEDMTHEFPRPLAIGRLRGAVQEGRVQALDLALASPSVTASQTGRLNQSLPGPGIAIVAGAWDQPFAIPHYRVTGYRAPATVPVSSWRSVGASGNGFMHECAFDELIHAAGADALAERLRLCTHEPTRRVLQAVGTMSGWGTPLPPGRVRGLACTLSFGVPVAEVVEVTLTAQGLARGLKRPAALEKMRSKCSAQTSASASAPSVASSGSTPRDAISAELRFDRRGHGLAAQATGAGASAHAAWRPVRGVYGSAGPIGSGTRLPASGLRGARGRAQVR